MASAVVMPKLGWNMEAGSLVEWLKQEGDFVKAGEVIFTVESDKAVSEVEALEDGVLRIPADSPATGQQVPVGTVLAYLLDRQEAAEETTVTSPAAFTPEIRLPNQAIAQLWSRPPTRTSRPLWRPVRAPGGWRLSWALL